MLSDGWYVFHLAEVLHEHAYWSEHPRTSLQRTRFLLSHRNLIYMEIIVSRAEEARASIRFILDRFPRDRRMHDRHFFENVVLSATCGISMLVLMSIPLTAG